VGDAYLYVVGHDCSPGPRDPQWRIEKRDRGTGALVSAFNGDGVVVTNPTAGIDDIPNAVAVDDSYLYVAGYDCSSGNYGWRIEKRLAVSGGF
jgi:hypothetical protein